MWLCLKYQLPLARQGSGSRYGGGSGSKLWRSVEKRGTVETMIREGERGESDR